MYGKYVLIVLILVLGLITSIEAQPKIIRGEVREGPQSREGPIRILRPTERIPVKVITKYRCPKTCNCPVTYEPVCGKSGMTHSNACLATCFKDKIKNKGKCNNCNNKPTTQHKCRTEKIGRTGSRRVCCTTVLLKGRVISRRCKKSKTKYISYKNDCHWKTKKNGEKQKYCCRYKKAKCGKISHYGKKTCRYVGEKITVGVTKGCIMKAFGEFSKRKYCCKTVKTCQTGKKCRRTKRCSYRGPTFSTYRFDKCNWAENKKRKCKQRKCCKIVKKCKTFGNGKTTCKKQKKKCVWVGERIKKETVTRCGEKPYGLNSKRTHCCNWKLHYKNEKLVRKELRRCYWKGCAVTRQRRIVTTWANRKTKNGKCKQRRRCTTVKNCSCGKCALIRRTCKWTGNQLWKRVNHGCTWAPCSEDGRQKKCCTSKRVCKGDVCEVKRTCKRKGPVIRRTDYTKCKWVTVATDQKRRRCCDWTKVCEDKSCSHKKVKCSLGEVLLVNNEKKYCNWKKVSDIGEREYCCKEKYECTHTKGTKKCRMLKQKCDFRGVVVTKKPKKTCEEKMDGNGCTQNHCCEWTEVCEGGKNCFPENNKCGYCGKKTCPTTAPPTTAVPTTHVPTTKTPSTSPPTTKAPSTSAPTTKAPTTAPSGKNFCVAEGDPHMRSFTRQRFNFYKMGDYVLYKSNSMTVHTRVKGKYIFVNSAVAAQLNDLEVVASVNELGRDWLINQNKLVKLSNGQVYKLEQGGSIRCVNDKKVFLTSAKGDIVELLFRPRNGQGPRGMINVIITTDNISGAKGLCVGPSHNGAGKGLFRTYYKGGDSHVATCDPSKLSASRQKCVDAGIIKDDLDTCAVDVCNGLDPQGVRDVEIETGH